MSDKNDEYLFVRPWIGGDQMAVSKIELKYLESLGDLVGHLITDSKVEEYMKEYRRHDMHITKSEIEEQILKAVVEQITTHVRTNYIEKEKLSDK